MNRYVVLEKEDIKVAVDIETDTSGQEISELKSEGFVITAQSIQADSTEAAIAQSMNTKANVSPDSIYRMARRISLLISWGGWIVFGVGIVVLILGLNALGGPFGGVLLFALSQAMPGAGIMILGLLMVAAAQMLNATVDTADNSRRILEHLQHQ